MILYQSILIIQNLLNALRGENFKEDRFSSLVRASIWNILRPPGIRKFGICPPWVIFNLSLRRISPDSAWSGWKTSGAAMDGGLWNKYFRDSICLGRKRLGRVFISLRHLLMCLIFKKKEKTNKQTTRKGYNSR